ncbi:hypothetical protein PR202_ga12517 [Eleusine coracana subsp. coracana]|uniref:DUF659 domain-containing protein n=1 Tax=Eleusine coracana subsp. coracana TaxID=191504 RepID=A0AAV5CCC2_ELECO|nr:hypothetical protein PR202_ga12517 [Eleusine coracana subsp. coracana]
MDERKHMDALIAIAFYSGGIAFNFARNPYLQEAFTYACSNDLKDNCEGDVKTKEHIADKLRFVIEEVGRKNVVQIINDNAANCKGEAQMIKNFSMNHGMRLSIYIEFSPLK